MKKAFTILVPVPKSRKALVAGRAQTFGDRRTKRLRSRGDRRRAALRDQG